LWRREREGEIKFSLLIGDYYLRRRHFVDGAQVYRQSSRGSCCATHNYMTIVQTNMTMMMPSFTSSILVIVILLCLQQFVTVAAGGSGTSNTGSDDICSYDYEINCQGGSPYAAITSVTLASAVSSGGGEAYVTFHWGQTHTDTNVGSILQPMNTPQTLKESHEYYQEGEYYAGVSIVFGAGSGCNGVKLQGYKLLKFVGLSCDVIDLEHEEEVDGSLAGTTSSTLAVVSSSSHFLPRFWLFKLCVNISHLARLHY
jgi:hypothetical protein